MDARSRHGRRSRSWLARRTGFLSLRETKGDERDAAFDYQEVNGDLTDAPVGLGAGGEVRVARLLDPREQPRAPLVARLCEETDGLADPGRTVRRVIRYGERHSDA